jgi:protein O-GlcNAc transferase
LLNDLKRHHEAIAHYDKALSIKPDIDWVYGYLVHTKMKICSWSSFAPHLCNIVDKLLINKKLSAPFPLLSLVDSPLLHKKLSSIYIQEKFPFNPSLGPILKKKVHSKIRIGYFSGDFRTHAVSILTAEMFEMHDKNCFGIFAFFWYQ